METTAVARAMEAANPNKAHQRVSLLLAIALVLATGYLGLALLLGTSAPFLLVTGSSMEPTMHAGDIVMSRRVPASQIEVGQVVAFETPTGAPSSDRLPRRIAHRVIAIRGEGGKLVLTTKGDNADADPFKVTADDLIGVIRGNLGPIGKPLLYMPSRRIMITVGLPLLAFVMIVLATKSAGGEGSRDRDPDSSGRIRKEFAGLRGALDGLANAVAEYGTRLRPHTAAVKNLAGATDELRQVARRQHGTSAELQRAVRVHDGILKQFSASLERLTEESGALTTPPRAARARKRSRSGSSRRSPRSHESRAA